MKHLIKILFLSAFIGLMMQSCFDKDYDWDDIDKNGVLSIPPIMFGSFDTIYVEGLEEGIIPEGIPIPNFSIAKSDTIDGIFDGDAVKDFFFDGAGAVEIAAKADIELDMTGLKIDLYFNILNNARERIENIKIPSQSLTTEKNQTLSIKIAAEYMKHMENAQGMELTIVISSTSGDVRLDENDYIFLKNIIIKTGGYHFEL
jgi:hypothetical protein